jgi:hypothetical protein
MSRLTRLFGLGDRFAQQVERGGDPRTIQLAYGRDAVVQGFARYEARGQALGQSAAPNEAEDLLLLAEPEEAGAEHQG